MIHATVDKIQKHKTERNNRMDLEWDWLRCLHILVKKFLIKSLIKYVGLESTIINRLASL